VRGSPSRGCHGHRVTDDLASPPPNAASVSRSRRLVILVATALFVVSIGVLVGVRAVSGQDDDTTEVLVGPWDGRQITFAAVLASTVSFFVLVCAVPALRWWLAVFVPLRFLAFCAILPAGFLAAVVSENTVVPLMANGCATGYVVRESTPWRHTTIEVLRADGLVATTVDRESRRGGEHPFADGDYRVDVNGDTLRVRTYPSGTPSFTLPVVEMPRESCGPSDGRELQPTPSTTAPSASAPFLTDSDEGPAPAPISDARSEATRMAQLTFDAAEAPVTDTAGVPVSVPAASELPCDGTTAIALDIRTADNAASYAAILAAWDAEGSSADRAMHEDLRYNGSVRLSARDRSSIDGLMHFLLTADCRAPS